MVAKLIDCASEGDAQGIRDLAARGVDLDARGTGEHMENALMVASMDGRLEVRRSSDEISNRIRGPLKGPANVGRRATGLHAVASSTRRAHTRTHALTHSRTALARPPPPQVVKLLVEDLAADRNIRDSRGATCLHYAAEAGRPRVIQWLIGDGKMDVTVVDANGQTAMHYACREEQSPVIEVLKNMSTRLVNQKSHAGVTPLMLLVDKADKPKLVHRLVKFGAQVDAEDHDGNTALFYAARKNHPEVVSELLINHRADMNHVNREGKNAMAVAEEHDARKVLNVLANGGFLEDGKTRERSQVNRLGSKDLLKNESGVGKTGRKGGKRKRAAAVQSPGAADAVAALAAMAGPRASKAKKVGKREIPEGVPPQVIKKWEELGPEKRPARCSLCKNCLNVATMKQACLTMRDYFGDNEYKARGPRKYKPKPTPKARKLQDVVVEKSDIFEAARDGAIERVRELLEEGFDVDEGDPNDDDTTPLMYAALHGNNDIVDELILVWGADENVTDRFGTTVLMCAAQEGHHKLIKSLCMNPDEDFEDSSEDEESGKRKRTRSTHTHGHSVDPNIKNDDGDTALHYAAEQGHKKAVQMLLRYGADPTLKNNKKRTAQDEASDKGDKAIVKLLQAADKLRNKRGASKTPARPDYLTDNDEFDEAEARKEARAQAKLEREAKAKEREAKAKEREAKEAKEREVKEAKEAKVKEASAANAARAREAKDPKDPKAKDPRVPTPNNSESADRIEAMNIPAEARDYLAAVKTGNVEEVRKAVTDGVVGIETCNEEGTTGLMVVCMDGNRTMFDLLVNELKADPKAADTTGMTVLMHATQEGHTEIAKELIDICGVDINAASKDKDTALMYACQGGHIDTVKLLVEKGAELDALDLTGHSALMLAAEEGHLPTVSYLLQKGAKVDPKWLIKIARGTGETTETDD